MDKPNRNRVKVPESMVMYMCGEAKRTRKSKKMANSLRSASMVSVDPRAKKKVKQNKKKKMLKRKKRSRSLRLNEEDTREYQRALKRGFLTLNSTGFWRGRKHNALANVHREWCDDNEKPQIILCKASGGRPMDNIVVDLAPLRVPARSDDVELALADLNAQILMASEDAGMTLRRDSVDDGEDDDDEETKEHHDKYDILVRSAWDTAHIGKLPPVSMGVFEGERSKAKSMAKALSLLWEIPLSGSVAEDLSNAKSKKKKGLSAHRRRPRNPWNQLDL